jgi:uncharacterized protein (DUF2267 family)/iron-sulfur cluster repair protein YtfE (RIC family)
LNSAVQEKRLPALSTIGRLPVMIAAADTSQKTWETWRDLMGIIVKDYHDSLRATLPRLEGLAEQVAREHRAPIQILDRLLREFSALADSLRTHLLQQEGHLFPMIRQVCESAENMAPPCHLDEKLEELLDEATHDDQEAVASVRRAEQAFRGVDALRSEPLVAKLIKGIRELRQDLEEHVKLETMVLFPVAKEVLRRDPSDSKKGPPFHSGLPDQSRKREQETMPDTLSESLMPVLHALRDRLSVENAIALGARLPSDIRRLYYEDWQHRWDHPTKLQREDFLRGIANAHRDEPDRDPEEIARTVFGALAQRLPDRDIQAVKTILPGEIRSLWPPEEQPLAMAELITADQETG